MRSRSLLILVAACSSSDRLDWAAPPAQAVARCTYEQPDLDAYYRPSTLHFDERGRIVQYDGFRFEDVDLVRTSTRIEYDAQDRVVRKTSFFGETVITYTANEALEKSPAGTTRYELDNAGRVLRLPPAPHSPWFTYQYDAMGRVSYHGTSDGLDSPFTYDAEGRLASRTRQDRSPSTITYARNGADLEVSEMSDGVVVKSWTIRLDEQGRTARIDLNGSTMTYAYGPDVIEETYGSRTVTATGKCPLPTVGLAPIPYVIGRDLPYNQRLLRFPGPLFEGL